MSFPRLVTLLLCLVLPLQARAQSQPSVDAPLKSTTPPPLVPAPGPSEEGTGPEGEIIPPEEGSARGSGTRGSRIGLGILMGTFAGAVGAIPGTLLGLTGLCFDSCSGDEDSRLYIGGMLAFVGLSAGAALGIDVLGDVLQGKGRFWPTVLGVVLGTLGGLVAGGALVAVAGAVGIIPMIMGPAVGGVIAYEISHANVIDELTATTASRPRFVPLVSVSPEGGLIGGLAGRF